MQRKGSWSRLDLQEVMFVLIKIHVSDRHATSRTAFIWTDTSLKVEK